ncbi:MAG TPA: MIP/aquaporin family protein [Dongiaceae bacterium]|jgi:glycerol uptake facilitator-like aquaporin|nr:MIP/aquaporin family protein [Dongiaceae bacterium]
MPEFDLPRRVVAEFLGTWLLVATVVGSGIMAESLAGGNMAVALLGNTIATGAILVVLITMFGPLSGAHFNPAVSLVFLLAGELSIIPFALYLAAQVVGGIAGTMTAHLMFDLPLLQMSEHVRQGPSQFVSEVVAGFGLIATILGCRRFRADFMPVAVALYVVAGYWFTASTCFANPAVAVARSLTNTFSGIRPADAPWFIVAEIAGAMLSAMIFRWLLAGRSTIGAGASSAAPPKVPAPTGR